MVSYNLRYDVKPDSITVKQSLATLPDPTLEPSYLSLAGREHPWSSRRIRIAQDLLNEGVALAGTYDKLFRISTPLIVLGFQEALIRQVHDLAELLGDDWAWVWCLFTVNVLNRTKNTIDRRWSSRRCFSWRIESYLLQKVCYPLLHPSYKLILGIDLFSS